MKVEWPVLSFAEAKDTYETLHLFTQIVGKIRLVSTPWINHSWHVTLYVTPSGLTTPGMETDGVYFSLAFDLLRHQLRLETGTGEVRAFELQGLSVAEFYRKVMAALKELQIGVQINTTPNELENPTPFPEDRQHCTYEPRHAEALHQALLRAQAVFTTFRSEFTGKCSPVHFFWGSFDLAVSRFSGREAPEHPGGVPHLPDWVVREAYAKEVCSCGFWPGNEAVPFAAFYSYSYPEPEGYKEARVKPAEAYYHPELREFVLPYDAVQQASDPAATLLSFLRSTYNAAADLARWDRQALELRLPETDAPAADTAHKQTGP